MSMQAIDASEQLTPRQIGRRERSEPAKVTGRLKRALDLMVWEACSDNEAAVQTGMTLTAIRLAFQRPHVRAYLRTQREVLRIREVGRNFQTLIEVRDQTDNAMARIKAVHELEHGDEDSALTRRAVPGFCVQIINAAPANTTVQVIDSVEANNCLQMVSNGDDHP